MSMDLEAMNLREVIKPVAHAVISLPVSLYIARAQAVAKEHAGAVGRNRALDR
jgi:hypothetical protein